MYEAAVPVGWVFEPEDLPPVGWVFKLIGGPLYPVAGWVFELPPLFPLLEGLEREERSASRRAVLLPDEDCEGKRIVGAPLPCGFMPCEFALFACNWAKRSAISCWIDWVEVPVGCWFWGEEGLFPAAIASWTTTAPPTPIAAALPIMIIFSNKLILTPA